MGHVDDRNVGPVFGPVVIPIGALSDENGASGSLEESRLAQYDARCTGLNPALDSLLDA